MALQQNFNITLDLKKQIAVASQIPTFIQNDTSTLFITLVDNGKAYDFASADRYVINMKRPDGKIITGLATYDTETQKIKYNFGSTEMELAGNLEVSISLFLGESRISTRPFMVRILKDYEEGIPSEEGYSALQELFIEVDTVKSTAQEKAQYAQESGDYARAIRDNFGHKGNYDNTKSYKNGNVVSYGGTNYICVQDTTVGINPLNGAYWTVVAPQATFNEQSWVAVSGQKTFTLTNGSYTPQKGGIQVTVGGVPQVSGVNFTESSETTISFAEAIPSGLTVYAKWMEGALSITKGHKSGHEKGGQDELDVTKLYNYTEHVANKFTEVSTSLAEKVYYFNTVADMKASTKLKAGDSAITMCYQFTKDGGGGTYQIVNDLALVDDGGSVHALANGLKARLIIQDRTINIKQWGAKGGSGWADDTQAIKKAVAFLNTSVQDAKSKLYGGGTLFFPYGVFVCKEPLLINLNVKLKGQHSRSWNFYQGKNSSSIIRFKEFANPQQAAIKFAGYLADESTPSGYTITETQAELSISSADNVSMEDIAIQSVDVPILLGINLINATSARLINVGVLDFKYSILSNHSFGSSYEKIFSISKYGGFISYIADNGISIRDSYFTVGATVIPIEDVIVDQISQGSYPNDSFGILTYKGTIGLDNVIIEKPKIGIRSFGSRLNVNTLHMEVIEKALIEVNDSLLNVNIFALWNSSSSEIKLIKGANSRGSITNTDINVSNVVDLDDACKFNFKNCLNVKYTNINPIHTSEVIKELITFDPSVIVEWTSSVDCRYAYKSGKQVFIQFQLYTSALTNSGTTLNIGTLPIGYRPILDISHTTRHGTLKIKKDGTMTFTLFANAQYILYETISFLS
jgi:hypothetical protein